MTNRSKNDLTQLTWGGVSTERAALMAEREQIKKGPSRTETEPDATAPASTEKSEKLKAELDDLLGEIDEVLDENAEEFVRAYVQKGGE